MKYNPYVLPVQCTGKVRGRLVTKAGVGGETGWDRRPLEVQLGRGRRGLSLPGMGLDRAIAARGRMRESGNKT